MSSSSTFTKTKDCSSEAENSSLRIPFYYLFILLSILFIASIKYFIDLKKQKLIYVKDISSHIKEYLKLLMKFRSMYGLIFTQLFDQVSDISVMNQLYHLSTLKNTNCNEYLSIFNLFATSLSVFIIYHVMSSILIYRFSRGDLKLSLLQLFGLAFVKHCK